MCQLRHKCEDLASQPAPQNKRVTRTLSVAQAERYRPLFDNTKRLRELVAQIEALSARAVEQAEGWGRRLATGPMNSSYANTPL